MTLTSLLLFAGALAVMAGMPGPSVAALVARVLSRGARDVLPFIAAMWVGEAIWISCTVWGLSALAHSFQTAFSLLRWAGAAYLAWLAWKMWHAPVDEDEPAAPPGASPLRMFAAGLAVTLGNPKIMVFYLALLPGIVDIGRVGITGWLELLATAVAVLMVVDLGWTAAAHQARGLLRSARARRATNRASAGVMAGAAAAIAVH